MRQYEMTYLISDKVLEADLNKITGKVNGEITDFGGKLLKEEIWKRRKLAYAIKKQEYATYVTILFDLPKDKANKLEREVRLLPQVIRHLMLVREEGAEALTLSADEILGTEAIEEVIGGDKAFEAVRGETEASKDLMAIRDKEDTAEAKDESDEAKVEDTTEVKAEDETEKQKNKKTKEVKNEKPAADEKTEETAEEVKKPRAKKAKKPENEADRLAKLDEELDNILKDEL